MAIKTINDEHLVNIATAIRSKNGTETTYKPSEMAAAIAAITTGGGSEGGSSLDTRTPDEIYEQERPAEWPVLPDPTEDNETYFLCLTTESKQCVCPQGYYDKDKTTTEFGYIDDNGAFVTIYTLNDVNNSYWGGMGLSSSWVSPQMDKYHVVRVTGGDPTFENCTSSTNASSSKMKDVLEIKIRVKNPYFGSVDPGGYSQSFSNVNFITFYGPQEWTAARLPSKFESYKGLKCLRFDSEENNPFLKPNTTFTDISRMFYYCSSLRYTYPILENWTAVTNIDYLYGYCYDLKSVTLESETVTDAASVIAFCHGLQEASIKLPKVTADAMSGNSSPYLHKYHNLDISGLTSGTNQRYLSGYVTREILNLKLGPIANLTGNNIARPYSGGYCIRRITMSPEQTGDNMPGNWRVHMYPANYTELKEFFESLPTVTSGNTITLYNYAFSKGMPDELISIATNKGYTLTVAG